MVPRGLRIRKTPTFIFNEDFHTEWNRILTTCSIELMNLIIREEEKKIKTLDVQIKEIQSYLNDNYDATDFQKLNEKFLTNIKKIEDNITQYKQRKYKRDTHDYKTNQIYTWHTTRKSILKNPNDMSLKDKSVVFSSTDLDTTGGSSSSIDSNRHYGDTIESTRKSKNVPGTGEGESIINIGKTCTLDHNQCKVLQKGLSFAPAHRADLFQTIRDINKFIRNLTIKKHFILSEKEEDTQIITSDIPIPLYMNLKEQISTRTLIDLDESHNTTLDPHPFKISNKDFYPISSRLSSKRTTPERCPRPLLPQDCKQEDPDVPQDHQGEDLPHINTTETYVRGDVRSKEEIPTDNRPDDGDRRSQGHLISSIFKSNDLDITQDTIEVYSIIPDIPSSLHSRDLSSDPVKQVQSSNSSQTSKKMKHHKWSVQSQNDLAENKPLSCSEYGNSFSSNYERIDTKDTKYLCSKCGKKFTRKSKLVQHERMHAGEKPYSCLECGKCFTRRSACMSHKRIHTGEKPYSCSECGKCYRMKQHLDAHHRSHTGEKPYFCSECGKCFALKELLVKHHRTHTGEKPYSCSECGKCYSMKQHLDAHHRSHTGEKPYLCSECGKCFALKELLVKHHRTHTGEKPYLCSECGKCFTHRSTLSIHKVIHTREKPHACSECEICFAKKSDLVTHQLTHIGVKLYSCLECGKCFKNKSHLVEHKIIHTGEKPHACSECGKCFAKKSNLVAHKIIHTGVKPHACSECEKCFAKKSILVRHQLSHTGVKSYSCLECGKCFTNISDLITHNRTHTGNEPLS
ncbi:uncharacterized protein LOC142258938 [Anomaloglossus baeobatrachus]|uniref:uncharacterized protein LOC142258938 n=1 Tax=Anomaloglossus baeobatrachus TaxID=238106 RepID=UPI003F500204